MARLGVIAFVVTSPLLAIAYWYMVIKGDREALLPALLITIVGALVVYAVATS